MKLSIHTVEFTAAIFSFSLPIQQTNYPIEEGALYNRSSASIIILVVGARFLPRQRGEKENGVPGSTVVQDRSVPLKDNHR